VAKQTKTTPKAKTAPKLKVHDKGSEKGPTTSTDAPKQMTGAAVVPPQKRDFDDIISSFVQATEALHYSLPLTMTVLSLFQEHSVNQLKAMGDIREETGDTLSVKIPIEELSRARTWERLNKNVHHSARMIPSSFLMALVSQYDAYLSQLIGHYFHLKPEVLNASERKFSLSELSRFSSIDDAKTYLIEKEVEGVLRESHSKQFSWLETKLDIKLTEGLDSWPKFIEVTERRNLFTHTNGIVSNQYISVCKKHGVKIPPDLEIGATLEIDPAYFRSAYATIVEVGVKLGHVMWRKLDPNTRSQADSSLNATAFDLIKNNELKLAQELLRFATSTIKKHSSDRMRRMMIINLAQALKHDNQNEKCKEILDSDDWSSCELDFQICLDVLADDFAAAAEKMRKIGKEGSVGVVAYRDWPIFKDFRKTEKFLNAYRDVFGKDYKTTADTEKASGPSRKTAEVSSKRRVQ
jgi:hypothetical protein